jgi:hypothetical protein
MAEQGLFAKSSSLNIVPLEEKLAYLVKVRSTSRIDIGCPRRTRPGRRLSQSNPFLRYASEDHSAYASISDRKSLQPTLSLTSIPEPMDGSRIGNERSLHSGRKRSESQAST